MKTTVLTWVGQSHNSEGQECANHYHHRHAIARSYQHPFGSALRAMLEGWERYALAHRDRYDDPVGKDYVLGPAWYEAGQAIRRLLDGECGGWDCGSLNHNILRIMGENGFDCQETGYVEGGEK